MLAFLGGCVCERVHRVVGAVVCDDIIHPTACQTDRLPLIYHIITYTYNKHTDVMYKYADFPCGWPLHIRNINMFLQT